jgi:hypothetical protein
VTGGIYAKVTGGNAATVTGGNLATVTGGNRATLVLSRPDSGRRRLYVAYVGEDGILPGVPYRLDIHHRFVRADGDTAPTPGKEG